MAWQESPAFGTCKECETPFLPGDQVWYDPPHMGVARSLNDGAVIKTQVDAGGLYCYDCGIYLEDEENKNAD
jgi:hypothetical protein